MGEHQEWSKFSNFEVATRVPFIISKSRTSQPTNLFEGYSSILHKLRKPNPYYRNNKSHLSQTQSQNSVKYLQNKQHQFAINKKDAPRMKSKCYREWSQMRKDYKLYDGLVELVDLFPTLVDLSGLPAISTCPENSEHVPVCTEGSSLAPVLNSLNYTSLHVSRKVKAIRMFPTESSQNKVFSLPFSGNIGIKKAAFSQYPRPGPEPSVHPDSDQPPMRDTTIMGYSMRTNRYRYTAWLKFNNVTFKPDWSNIIAEELYDHKVDAEENYNVCGKNVYALKKKHLCKELMKGWRNARTVYLSTLN